LAGLALAVGIASGQQPSRKTAEDWPTYGLTPGEERFSPLTQIAAANVKVLGLAWSYDLGPGGGGQEATPLAWNGTLYGITNWSVVFAVDAATGKKRWRWDPDVNQAAVRPKICGGVVKRGLAIYQGMVIAPVIGGKLQTLDAETGKVIWEARVASPQDDYRVTIAPRIAHGKVVVNDGRLLAYSADAGEKQWVIQTGLRGGMGPPIKYQVGGKQDVSLMGGVGAVTGNAGPQDSATPRDPKLLTFMLDGTGKLPGGD
jgi:quinohemoprotein ethanol dehydrogenase